MVGRGHQCWVTRKRYKCFRCGQPNHLAVVCKSQTGVAVKVQEAQDSTVLCREIDRLSRQLEFLTSNADPPLAGPQDQEAPEAAANKRPFGERPVPGN
ncbi:zinc knuckle protein [Gregarina niphandrodes]|uniref:Zinc knuckle protein n=1 Tax=Gregarina niphandrodes TaxID=110365 RepID=A0A023AWE3_GRENI|nr:zinc knuckle protein [Gregarina niphandrodes]EZG43034.1 zinc knuckle protein [Gregarina niphandrodes]|eukprot:XP_011133694.1 zinc knuckle protein [Gregarina niphandrodes]